MSSASCCAKWILAGEHTVIRGGGAIAFPYFKKSMTLNYEPHEELKIKLKNEAHKKAFIKILEISSEQLKIPFNEIKGIFSVTSNIPISAGLGSSAALCVSVAKFFKQNIIQNNLTLDLFAKTLENSFHCKSSGLDVAVIINEKPIFFRDMKVNVIAEKFHPNFKLTYSGRGQETRHCVNKVFDFFKTNPKEARLIEQKMNDAVASCANSLESNDLVLLAHGMNKAKECFFDWGICPDFQKKHIDQLINQGALAAKPIGGGGGGYVLSLWK